MPIWNVSQSINGKPYTVHGATLRILGLRHDTFLVLFEQYCGSKYIEFGSGYRILAQFGSRVILSILKVKIKNNFSFFSFSLKNISKNVS